METEESEKLGLVPHSAEATASTSEADIVVIGKDGNIVSDSRRDRIEEKKRLGELIEKYRRSQDQVLASLRVSYHAAVDDPDNELVHLYEIRDALSAKFGKENTAQVTLAISNTKWKRLGKLANDDPLRQGRHRGEKVGELRNATESELKEARDISRNMIEAYLDFLERQSAE